MPAASPKIDASPPIFAHELPNGLALRVVESEPPGKSALDLVSVQLWIGSGAGQERDSEHGMAHLLEHLVFKPWRKELRLPTGQGREKVGATDLAGAIEELGGDCNAYTSYDETVYYAHVPGPAVQGALQALHESVFYPRIDARELGLEREVVIEEICQYNDDPASQAQETLLSLLYPDNPLGRPILGSVEGLRGYLPRQVRSFHRRHYQAKNAMVVVCGPVKPKEILKICRKVFKEVPSPARGRRNPSRLTSIPARTPKSRRVDIAVGDVVESSIRLGYPGPAMDHIDAVALDAACVILGQGESSSLQRELLRERALVSEISAACYLGPQCSTLQVSTQCAAENFEQVIEAVLQEVDSLAAEPPSSSALARACAQLESGLVYRRETVEGMAHACGWSVMVAGGDEAEAQYFEQLRSLTPEQVQRAVRQWMSRKEATISAVIPEGAMERGKRRTLQKNLLASPKPPRKTKLPRAKKFGRSATQYELAPGFTLLCQVDRRIPMASGQWLAQAGPYGETLKHRGRYSLLSRMLTRGTPGRDALRWAEEIEGYAASLEGVCGWRSVGVYFEGLARHAGRLVDRAAECLSAPLLDKREFEREKSLVLDEMKAEQDDLAHQCIRAMRRDLYGSHPLAEDRRGDEKSIKSCSRRELRSAHEELLAAPQVIALAGDFDPEEMVERIQAWRERVPAWQAERSATVELKAPCWSKQVKRRHIEKDRDQVHLAWGYPGLEVGDPRSAALELVLQILGGQTGRLFMRMREEEPLVYAVSASAFVGAGAGHICLYAATSAEKLPRARLAMHEVVEELLSQGASEDELERARRSLLGQMNASLQRRSRMASSLAAAHVLGLDPDHNAKLRKSVERASLRDVMRVANEFFQGEARAKAELGPVQSLQRERQPSSCDLEEMADDGCIDEVVQDAS